MNMDSQKVTEIDALCVVSKKYKHIIANDNILSNDFEQLIHFLRISDPSSEETCTKIINYLLEEIHEPVGNYQFMSDESQEYQDVCYKKMNYFHLKDAMDNFCKNYIT